MLAFAAVAYGQLDSNSITINELRTIDLQPDQVIFAVTVQAPASAGLDEILGALHGSGITSSELVSVSPPQISVVTGLPLPQPVTWTFLMPAGIERMSATVAALTALQQTIGQNNSGLNLRFTVQGTQASAGLQQPDQCPVADLVRDAQMQARKLADAAGLTAGPIIALSDGSIARPPAVAAGLVIPTAAVRTGDFSTTIGTFTFTSTSQFVQPVAFLYCDVIVKFQLLRYQ